MVSPHRAKLVSYLSALMAVFITLDLRIIVGAASAQGAVDSAVEAELLPHIRRRLAVYHRENFQPVQIDGTQSSVVLLSDASWQKNEQAGDDVPRYVDPTSKRSFALDHVRLVSAMQSGTR